jgi:hypothetical protein
VEADPWLFINPLNIEALLNYSQYQRDDSNGEYKQSEWEGGLSLEQRGYILHPSVVRFHYVIEPRYRSSASELVNNSDRSSSELFGYRLSLGILQDSILPVDGGITASNSNSVINGNLGQRNESDLTNYAVYLNWRYAPFPASFRFEQRTNVSTNTTLTGGNSFRRDDVERIVQLKAKSSKTSMFLETRDLDDRVSSRSNDFKRTYAYLRHQLEWGRGSGLQSNFDYTKRSQFNDYTQIRWSQVASIRHTGSLISHTNYRFQSTRQATQYDTNTGGFRLVHNLYSNLVTSAGVNYRNSNATNFKEKNNSVSMTSRYQKKGYKGVGISLNVLGRLNNIDQDSSAGFLDIVDQSYSVPLTGEVVLEHRFIATQTIIVTDATSTIVYSEGIDYEVVGVSGGLTQLRVIPGGQIEAGNVVLVSYKAAIQPSVEYRETVTGAGFGFTIGGFSIAYDDSKSTNDLKSGFGGFLTDTRTTTAQASYAWEWGRTSNQIRADHRYYRNGNFETTSRNFSESISFSLDGTKRLSLGLNQSFNESNVDTKNFSGALSLDWRPKPGWVIQPRLSVWKRITEYPPGSSQTENEDLVVSANLVVRWAFRKLSWDLAYYHNERTTSQDSIDIYDTTENSFRMSFRRRF